MALSNKALFFQHVSGNRVPINQLGNIPQLALAHAFIHRAIAFSTTLPTDDFPLKNFPTFPYEKLETEGKNPITAAIFQLDQFFNTLDAETFHERNISGVRTVVLDNNWRERIRSYIQHIRTEIDGAEMEPRMKESIIGKLNQFSADIERGRTRLDSCIDVFLRLTAAAGQGARNLRPALKLIQNCSGGMENLFDEQQQAGTAAPKLPSPDSFGLIENHSDEPAANDTDTSALA
ncbi:MAG: hypothetical protein COB54_07650 [Alphaproteobacteria bacterium]|nr:MAG: hypothetical protein COB54_07650 [Alphaproteobacteria bacterium]